MPTAIYSDETCARLIHQFKSMSVEAAQAFFSQGQSLAKKFPRESKVVSLHTNRFIRVEEFGLRVAPASKIDRAA